MLKCYNYAVYDFVDYRENKFNLVIISLIPVGVVGVNGGLRKMKGKMRGIR